MEKKTKSCQIRLFLGERGKELGMPECHGQISERVRRVLRRWLQRVSGALGSGRPALTLGRHPPQLAAFANQDGGAGTPSSRGDQVPLGDGGQGQDLPKDPDSLGAALPGWGGRATPSQAMRPNNAAGLTRVSALVRAAPPGLASLGVLNLYCNCPS